MPQGEDLGQHSGVAADQQPQSTDEPDHHQVQQSNRHTDDRYHAPENPSSPHVRQVLARYRRHATKPGARACRKSARRSAAIFKRLETSDFGWVPLLDRRREVME
jgi:hypothetical protein